MFVKYKHWEKFIQQNRTIVMFVTAHDHEVVTLGSPENNIVSIIGLRTSLRTWLFSFTNVFAQKIQIKQLTDNEVEWGEER